MSDAVSAMKLLFLAIFFACSLNAPLFTGEASMGCVYGDLLTDFGDFLASLTDSVFYWENAFQSWAFFVFRMGKCFRVISEMGIVYTHGFCKRSVKLLRGIFSRNREDALGYAKRTLSEKENTPLNTVLILHQKSVENGKR